MLQRFVDAASVEAEIARVRSLLRIPCGKCCCRGALKLG